MDRTTRTEIFFLDARLTDLDTLLQQLPTSAKAVIIEPEESALNQILAELATHDGVDAIHLVSHGSTDTISLGDTTLTSGNIDLYSEALLSIGTHLTDSADILVYGCDVAQSASGKQLIDRIAELTGADVTASDDTTGATALGGDWDLEYQAGEIESAPLSANYSGILAAPAVNNLTAISITEGDPAIKVDTDISFTGSSDLGGGYIEFSLANSNSDDQFDLIAGGNITVSGSSVYHSGTFIGVIDNVYNGQNGQNLRINFQSDFQNPSFEDSVNGWTIGESRVILGSTVINGHTTPDDVTDPPSSGDDAGGIGSGMTYSSQWTSDQKTDGQYSLRLYNSGQTADGFDVVHGPYAYSNTFKANANDTLYFDWRAAAGGDAFDAFGYLMKADGSQHVVVLDQTGADDSGNTNWATESVVVPSTGDWYFVFVAGTYDFTGGRAVGGSLYIDNFQVFGDTVNDSVLNDLARQVEYQNTGNDSLPTRNLTVSVVDRNGNTGSDTTTLSIAQMNNAPSFTNSGTLASIAEGNVDPAGASIATIFNGLYSDPDTSLTPADTLVGIAVTGDSSGAEGTWEYSTDAGSSWYAIGTVSNDAALLLSSTSLVRFVPADPDWSGTPGSLSVHAVDSSAAISFTNGSTRQTFDTTTDGGDSAVSAGSVNLNTQVTAVNDDPTASDIPTGALSILEEASTSVDLSGMTIADIDAGASNVTLKVVASSGTLAATSGGGVTAGGSGTGTLTLTGTLADLNTYISDSSAITYQGATNVSGAESLSLYVNDNGNTGAGGGTDIAIGSGLTVNITAVNDAPYGTTDTLDLNEDQPHTFTVADFGFSDGDDSPANNLASVMFTSVPAEGALTLNGVAVNANDEVSAADILAGNLVYTPAAEQFGAGYSSLAFKVRDDGGTANGGVNLSVADSTLTFDVATVADTPEITEALTQNGQQSSSGLVVTRGAEDGAEVTHFKITSITNGTLYQNDGTTEITNGDFITFAQANAGLKFTPDSYLNGSFEIQGSTSSDDSGLGDAPATATIVVNRPPSFGGSNTTIMVIDHAENRSFIDEITAIDPDDDELTYSISGGDDSDLFELDSATGALRFIRNPNFESPRDGNGDNIYEVVVTVTDGFGGEAVKRIQVHVNDVSEGSDQPAQPEEPDTPVTDPTILDPDNWGGLADDDGDGIPQLVEDLVPTLSGDTTGDGNGDGVPDQEQQDVSSVPFKKTPLPSINPEAEPVFVSLVGGSDNGKSSGSTTNLSNVRQTDKPDTAPDNLDMPIGLVEFVADVGSAGATESFSLYVEGSVPVSGYWKQDSNDDWVNLASPEYGGKIVLEGNKLRLDFQITDGGEFDADGEANGVIVDPGALSFDSDWLTEMVQSLYIAYYQRPADNAGLEYWRDEILNRDGDVYSIAEDFANTAESQRLYGTIDAGNVDTFIDAIYMTLFNRTSETEGQAFYRDAFLSGTYEDGRPATGASLMLDILNGARNEDGGAVSNKVDTALMFTWLLDANADGEVLASYGLNDEQATRDWFAQVTENDDSRPDVREIFNFLANTVSDEGDPITLIGDNDIAELLF